MKRALFIIAVLGAVGVGVWQLQPEPPAPPAPAPETGHVDAVYRFRLDLPAPPWRLRLGDEARKVADALVVADDGAGNWCAVNAERSTRPLTPDWGEPARVGAYEARRLGHRVRFVRDRHLFQLWCWGVGARVDPLLAAFAPLAGDVKGRATVAAPADRRGVGWAVDAGRFVSWVHRFGVEPPAGWTLVVGSALPKGAHVGLKRAEATLTLTVHRHPDASETTLRRPVEARERAGSLQATYLGQPVSFAGYVAPSKRTGLHATTRRLGGQLHELLLTRDADVEVDWTPVLAAFGPIPANVQARAADPRDRLSKTASIRDGVYRNFEHGFRWGSIPLNLELTLLADGVRANDLATGLRLEVVRAASAPDPSRPCSPAVAVDGRWGPTKVRSCTTRVETAEIRAWGDADPPVPMIRVGALEGPTDEKLGDNGFRDLRCGFEVRAPGDGWRFEDRTLDAIADKVRHVAFAREGAEVHGFAAFGSAELDMAVFSSEMRRDLLKTLGEPPPEIRVETRGLRFYAVAARGVPLEDVRLVVDRVGAVAP